MDLVAYVDESESRQGLDAGTYILCATIVRASEVADLRVHMASLRPPSRKKLHWHDDNDHRSTLDFLQGLRARHVVDSSIRFDHEPGPAEPLLWIADIVCGAVTQDRIGNATVLDPIRASITFCEAAPG